MRIGELAERSGVSKDTVRFYERNGLITSVAGNSATNNYRNYPEDSLARLNFFTKARDAGMSIADMKDIINTIADSCDPDVRKRVIDTKISELKDRAEKIQRVIRFLESGRKIESAKNVVS